MNIYLRLDGMEAFAKGDDLYAWHFTCIPEGDKYNKPEVGAVLVATTDYVMPSRADCIAPILAKLDRREKEIQTEAFKELQEVQQRKNDLLMLGVSSDE